MNIANFTKLTMTPYQERFTLVRAYLTKLTADQSAIDEVTQKVLIKVHQSIHTLHDQEKLTSCLKRIIYTTLTDHYREKRKVRTTALIEVEDASQTINEGNEEVIDCIKLLIELLPHPDTYSQLLKSWASVRRGMHKNTKFHSAQ
jgi:DNA-directed RNA polymerase specialized sigma24 family protein